MANALEFDNVFYKYPAKPGANRESFALENISFSIKPGTCAALTGENGSGKTTIGKLAAGILKPGKGRVLISGGDTAPLSLGQIGGVAGYLFQNPERQLFAPTVIEDLIFPAVIRGEPEENAKIAAREILGQMGLSGLEDRAVSRLSGGEKQRLALAGILTRNPRLLVLDEPTTGIDQKNRDKLGVILRELISGGAAVLLITHDINFADAHCGARLRIGAGGGVFCE